ncbi:MAG: DUF192 domain-containing protein [archaeon]
MIKMNIEIEKADTFLKRLIGLMFKKKIDKGLLFDLGREKKQGAAIHSFFVFSRFDAVFLDKNIEIVDIKRKIKPFKPYIKPKKPSRYILELPPGKADEEELKIGGKINL